MVIPLVTEVHLVPGKPRLFAIRSFSAWVVIYEYITRIFKERGCRLCLLTQGPLLSRMHGKQLTNQHELR